MKKLLILTAFVGLTSTAILGCGGGDAKVIEPNDPNEAALSADQQAQYEEQMRNQSSSSRPGN